MDWILIAENTWLTWWLDPLHWLAILKAGAALGFVVFVHELGHFAVAKMCGVKCEKFYVGFDFFELKIGKWVILPRALFKYKYGETEYGIGSFPLGGYVKMLGQDDNPGNMEKENERSRAGAEGSAAGKVQHDPRSYLAKSVPQRMAIISAGVIMNLIFAVIFATIAHKVGVPYRPCVVGDTAPGGAAWRAGLKPGDKILQINDGRVSEHLRWDWDMMNATIMAGVGGDMKLLVKPATGAEETILLHPRLSKAGGDERPVLGVLGEATTKLAKQEPAAKYTPASKAGEAFKGEDVVVALRPKSVATAIPVETHRDISAVLVKYRDEPIVVIVERPDPNSKDKSASPLRVEIEVAPNPRRTLGLVMSRGAITGVQPGSPAERAGLKEGDIIRNFAGEPFGDPLTVHFRLSRYVGQSIPLEIDREEANGELQSLTLNVVPREPTRIFDGYGEGDDFSIESLGVVYPVFQIVQHVLPDSPAAKAGLQAGDVITHFQFVPKSDDRVEENKSFYVFVKKPFKLDSDLNSWPVVDRFIQAILPETEVKLLYRRPEKGADFAAIQELVGEKGDSLEAILKPTDSPYFQDERGLIFSGREEQGHPAESWGEAFSLGLKQTYEDATKIVQILRKLVTGKMSPTNLGGIGTISLAATSEASQGTPRLLLFLTFLSANLAVVNFLPIPVLDGGHMMFLAWEGLFRRPVPEKWQFNLTLGGLAFVLCLFLFTNGMDFYRYIVVPITRWLG